MRDWGAWSRDRQPEYDAQGEWEVALRGHLTREQFQRSEKIQKTMIELTVSERVVLAVVYIHARNAPFFAVREMINTRLRRAGERMLNNAQIDTIKYQGLRKLANRLDLS